MKRFFFILVITAAAITAFSAKNILAPEHLVIPAAEINAKWLQAKPDVSGLKSGDLIFRHGRGFISSLLMRFGRREKKYSHAGIISIENGKAFVFHAIGGEEHSTNKLRKDPLEIFCSPADVFAFGIFRTSLSEPQNRRVMQLAAACYRSGLEFDTKFDLATDDKMYCTEFVYKIFCKALGGQNYLSLPAITEPQYISCDDLYCNERCTEIYSFRY